MSDESVYIVYIKISVISNVLTLTNIWKACRKRLNWHTYFQDKSLSRFQPSSESPRRFFYSVVFYGKDGTYPLQEICRSPRVGRSWRLRLALEVWLGGTTAIVFGPSKNEEEDPSLRSRRCRAEIIVQSSKEA